MEYIKSLVDNKKWGNPSGYDITVTRKGSGFDTNYTCVAEPHSVMEEHISEAWSKCKVNLNELYTNGDPFNPSVKPDVTPSGYDGSVEIDEIPFN